MYGIDKNLNFDFLVGKELLQLHIGLYQPILCFTDDLTIRIQCTSYLKYPDKIVVDILCDSPDLTKNLISLLGRTIKAVQTDVNDGELKLLFSDNFQLSLIDDSENFESFIITPADCKDQIVV